MNCFIEKYIESYYLHLINNLTQNFYINSPGKRKQNPGFLYSMGCNEYGQLGFPSDEKYYNTPQFVTIPGGEKVIQVSAGDNFSLVLTEGNNVYSFGSNSTGRLGIGSNIKMVNMPTKINIPGNPVISQISTSTDHSIILTECGEIYAFGNDEVNQLGLGKDLSLDEDPSFESIPMKVNIEGNKFITKVAACDFHSLIITEDGELYSFGENYNTKIERGNGDIIPFIHNIPTKIKIPNKMRVVDITGGSVFSIILTEDGKIYGFGDNTFGELGIKDCVTKDKLFLIWSATRVKQISSGMTHSMFLTEDGKVYIFGAYISTNIVPKIRREIPIGDIKVKGIVLGGKFSFILTEDGKVYTLGELNFSENYTMELGDPTPIKFDKYIVDISAGDNHILMICE